MKWNQLNWTFRAESSQVGYTQIHLRRGSSAEASFVGCHGFQGECEAAKILAVGGGFSNPFLWLYSFGSRFIVNLLVLVCIYSDSLVF